MPQLRTNSHWFIFMITDSASIRHPFQNAKSSAMQFYVFILRVLWKLSKTEGLLQKKEGWEEGRKEDNILTNGFSSIR